MLINVSEIHCHQRILSPSKSICCYYIYFETILSEAEYVAFVIVTVGEIFLKYVISQVGFQLDV